MAANPSGDPTHTRFTSQFHFQLLHAHSQPDLHNRLLMPPPPPPAPHLASSALINLPVKREQEGFHPGPQTGRVNIAVSNPPCQKQSEKGFRNFIPWQMKQEHENHQASADTAGPATNGVSNPPQRKQYQNGDCSIKWQVKQEHENHQGSLPGRPANSGVSNPPYQQQRSEKGAKHNAKGKIPKNSKSCGLKPSAECANEVSLANNCRYDSSLGLLTRKFVSLVQEAKDGTLDLNRTAEALEVQKRRIYDITNVLEGINLIEKTTKNHVHWKGWSDACPKDIEDELTKLKAEIRSLSAEERRLDDLIRVKQERLRFLEEGEDTQRCLFLTEQDILSVPCFQNQTVIAIKAPHASYIEVLDPDEDTVFSQRQYKMTIKSTTGPIDLYLLSKHKSPVEDVAVKQAISEQESNGFRSDVESSVLSSEDKSDLSRSCDSFVSHHAEGSGMQRITPAICHIEDDYWFGADPAVNITDLWD